MREIKAIIFDLDGTLYDLSDIVKMYYRMEIDFLESYFGKTESEAAAFLEENGVLSYSSPKAKSATELFLRMGVSKEVWSAFREENFDASGIDPSKAVNGDVIVEFSGISPIFLLSSNTYANIEKILKKLEIAPEMFSDILCSDRSPCEGIFNKKDVMEALSKKLGIAGENMLSIGDRYESDIKPVLLLGGTGVIVKSPKALGKLFKDISSGKIETCSDYEFIEKLQ